MSRARARSGRRSASRTSGSGASPRPRPLVELAPSDEFAHYGLARSLVNQGKQDEAKPHIKLARSLRPRTDPVDQLEPEVPETPEADG